MLRRVADAINLIQKHVIRNTSQTKSGVCVVRRVGRRLSVRSQTSGISFIYNAIGHYSGWRVEWHNS